MKIPDEAYGQKVAGRKKGGRRRIRVHDPFCKLIGFRGLIDILEVRPVVRIEGGIKGQSRFIKSSKKTFPFVEIACIERIPVDEGDPLMPLLYKVFCGLVSPFFFIVVDTVGVLLGNDIVYEEEGDIPRILVMKSVFFSAYSLVPIWTRASIFLWAKARMLLASASSS